ncbi:hypothetical protein BGX28_009329 [Mortierella sp. GBA30]|nr:hypothetical protein BGX28_009329 [Mortierella sp. GBA30]
MSPRLLTISLSLLLLSTVTFENARPVHAVPASSSFVSPSSIRPGVAFAENVPAAHKASPNILNSYDPSSPSSFLASSLTGSEVGYLSEIEDENESANVEAAEATEHENQCHRQQQQQQQQQLAQQKYQQQQQYSQCQNVHTQPPAITPKKKRDTVSSASSNGAMETGPTSALSKTQFQDAAMNTRGPSVGHVQQQQKQYQQAPSPIRTSAGVGNVLCYYDRAHKGLLHCADGASYAFTAYTSYPSYHPSSSCALTSAAKADASGPEKEEEQAPLVKLSTTGAGTDSVVGATFHGPSSGGYSMPQHGCAPSPTTGASSSQPGTLSSNAKPLKRRTASSRPSSSSAGDATKSNTAASSSLSGVHVDSFSPGSVSRMMGVADPISHSGLKEESSSFIPTASTTTEPSPLSSSSPSSLSSSVAAVQDKRADYELSETSSASSSSSSAARPSSASNTGSRAGSASAMNVDVGGRVQAQDQYVHNNPTVSASESARSKVQGSEVWTGKDWWDAFGAGPGYGTGEYSSKGKYGGAGDEIMRSKYSVASNPGCPGASSGCGSGSGPNYGSVSDYISERDRYGTAFGLGPGYGYGPGYGQEGYEYGYGAKSAKKEKREAHGGQGPESIHVPIKIPLLWDGANVVSMPGYQGHGGPGPIREGSAEMGTVNIPDASADVIPVPIDILAFVGPDGTMTLTPSN